MFKIMTRRRWRKHLADDLALWNAYKRVLQELDNRP